MRIAEAWKLANLAAPTWRVKRYLCSVARSANLMLWWLLWIAIEATAQVAPCALGSLGNRTNLNTFPVPPLKYLDKLSWRQQPAHYDLSGHASLLPSTKDFLRLVPDQPLAFGAVFSTETLSAKEWVIDIAFRIHSEAENSQHRAGGRGMGLWLTKHANPTQVTVDAQGNVKASPPAFMPSPDLDSKVSLFGNRDSFEGLGVIFDSSPTLPLQKRSENATYHRQAADPNGVVAGIMDDSTGDWIESAIVTPGKEAKYLQGSIGDCAAPYRNPNGLIWARLSYLDHRVSLHLDMSPHDTLSMVSRQFRNPCFSIEGVSLPTGYHIGLTGLASANPTPDAIDVYAVEAWEVLAPEKADEYQERLQTDAQENQLPLDGTEEATDANESKLLQQVIATQTTLLERIEALSAQVDQLQHAVAAVSTNPESHSAPPPVVHAPMDEQYLVQQIQKVAGQVQTLHHLVDTFQSKTSGTLSIVTARMGETFSLLQRSTDQLLTASATARAKTSSLDFFVYLGGAGLVGVVGLAIYRTATKGSFGGRGKKMI